MRRVVYLSIFALILLAIGPAFGQEEPEPTPTLSLNLATNTPHPTLPPALRIATNTPAVTATPSNTPMSTFTPTPTATPTSTPTDTPSPTPTPVGPFRYPDGVNSLTGLPYPSAAALGRRNLIVKVSNYPPVVRPQTGLNTADVLYEYEVEGGVTRFAAIYRSNAPEVVGPVRSGRLMDLHLVPMYQALFAYSGASGPVQELILGQDWRWQVISPSIGDNCQEAGFCRVERPGYAFEHTLFVNTNKVWERADARGINDGYPGRGFAFSKQPDPGGQPINDVLVDWYGQITGRWQYDAQQGRYERFTDGVEHLDAATGEPLWADNLIIIEVEHVDRPDLFEAESNTASIDINLFEQGRAYLYRDGLFYQGYWRRRSEDPGDALQILYGNNVPMMMKPGRTWVGVVRWMGDVAMNEQAVDAKATATTISLSATPTPTVTPTPTARP